LADVKYVHHYSRLGLVGKREHDTLESALDDAASCMDVSESKITYGDRVVADQTDILEHGRLPSPGWSMDALPPPTFMPIL
jgi:hypothetical protein